MGMNTWICVCSSSSSVKKERRRSKSCVDENHFCNGETACPPKIFWMFFFILYPSPPSHWRKCFFSLLWIWLLLLLVHNWYVVFFLVCSRKGENYVCAITQQHSVYAGNQVFAGELNVLRILDIWTCTKNTAREGNPTIIQIFCSLCPLGYVCFAFCLHDNSFRLGCAFMEYSCVRRR